MDGKDFEILASNRYPPAGGNVVGADEIKSREPVFPFDLRDVLSIEGVRTLSQSQPHASVTVLADGLLRSSVVSSDSPSRNDSWDLEPASRRP